MTAEAQQPEKCTVALAAAGQASSSLLMMMMMMRVCCVSVGELRANFDCPLREWRASKRTVRVNTSLWSHLNAEKETLDVLPVVMLLLL